MSQDSLTTSTKTYGYAACLAVALHIGFLALIASSYKAPQPSPTETTIKLDLVDPGTGNELSGAEGFPEGENDVPLIENNLEPPTELNDPSNETNNNDINEDLNNLSDTVEIGLEPDHQDSNDLEDYTYQSEFTADNLTDFPQLPLSSTTKGKTERTAHKKKSSYSTQGNHGKSTQGNGGKGNQNNGGQGAGQGGNKTPARYKNAPTPPYPGSARSTGAEGTVYLIIRVNTSGTPIEVRVAQSSGHPELDDAAQRYVYSNWTFHPATKEGQAIDSTVKVPVRFFIK